MGVAVAAATAVVVVVECEKDAGEGGMAIVACASLSSLLLAWLPSDATM
jgi:hypothetical protein